MIARITGSVLETFEKGVVLNTGPLAYTVYTPSIFSVGDEVVLHTQLIIRDDAHELYGFATPQEKALFSILIGVSGVGPKTALGMLCLYTLPDLVRSIRTGDAKAIALVPGIGKKTAEKVVIDLKDKVEGFDTGGAPASIDLIEALRSLGYKEHDIRTVISSVDIALPIEKQITLALQKLQK